MKAGGNNKELMRDYLRQGRPSRLRNQLVRDNLPLVRRLALKWGRNYEDTEDLIQVGCIGLVKAIDKFDPNSNAAFSTFANICIVGEIRHYMRDKFDLIRMPREFNSQLTKIEKAEEDLELEGGKVCTESIAARAKLSINLVRQTQDANRLRFVSSLEAHSSQNNEDDRKVVDSIEDKRARHNDDILDLRMAMEKLPITSQALLELYIQGSSEHKLEEMTGLRWYTIHRRLRTAIKALRKSLVS